MIEKTIISAVCDEYGVKYDALSGVSREQPLAEARQMAMYFLHREAGLYQKHIASVFNRNHSTVSLAIKSMDFLCRTNKSIKMRYERIKSKLGI